MLAMLLIHLWLPLKTVSALNMREHWAIKARRTKHHRSMSKRKMKDYLREAGNVDFAGSVITLTRYGKRKLDDDNLRGALKAVRDGIADAIGIDDGDASVRYEYAQCTDSECGVSALAEVPGGKA